MTAFLYTFLWFLRHTSEADYAVCRIDPDISRPWKPSLHIYTGTGRVLGDFVHAFHRDLGREDCLNRRRNCFDRSCYLLPSAGNWINPTLGGSSTIKLPNRLYHDLIELLCVWCVIWRLLWGARCLWKGPCSGLILTQPRFPQIRRYLKVLFCSLCGQCNTGALPLPVSLSLVSQFPSSPRHPTPDLRVRSLLLWWYCCM